jgi:hypothetical protein
LLTASGDQTTTTQQIINQIVGRIGAALGPAGQRPVSLEVLFLDPVSLQLVDPDGRALKYDLGDARSLSNQLSGAFVEVGSNVEVVVIPNPVGHYELSVADVHARARGAAVFFGNQTTEVRSLTEALRHTGSQNFSFDFIADVAAASDTVPQFAPLIATATVPAGFVRPIVPSLAAVLTSVNAFSELLLNSFSMTTTSIVDARGDSGGGRESQTAPLRDQTLVDELFGVWDRFDRDVFGQLKKEELDSVQALPSLFPALRIWQVMENLLDEFAAPHAARSGQNAPAKEHRAAKENADASESTQGNDKSAEDSAQSGATDAAGQDTASNAPIDDRSADSSNTTIQPEDSSADANTTGDIDADAIAA